MFKGLRVSKNALYTLFRPFFLKTFFLPTQIKTLSPVKNSSDYGIWEYAEFFNGNPNNKTLFKMDQPLNTPGGLGKEIKGNMQGTNILGRIEIDY